MNKNGFAGVAVLIALGIILLAGGIWYVAHNNYSTDPGVQYKLLTPIDEVAGRVSYKNQPAKIIKDSSDNNGLILSLDLLERNLKWAPGMDEPFFTDKNYQISDLHIDSSTKAYECNGTVPSTISTVKKVINFSQSTNNAVAYFDISGNNITAIYQQCLP